MIVRGASYVSVNLPPSPGREEVEAFLLPIELAVADRVGRLEHADARVGCKRQRRIEFPAGGDVFREAGVQSCQLSREVEIAKAPVLVSGTFLGAGLVCPEAE